MSDVFERAFGATKGAIDQSAAVPLDQFPAQAKIAQAGTINAGNSVMAAIEDDAAVQRKAAYIADTVALEAARANQATTADVTQILLSGMDAVKTGREQLVSESLAAIEKQKQLSQLQQNKPNPLLHPIQWVTDSLHENKLEGQIQDHSRAVRVVNANVTNVVNATAISANDLLGVQNLATSAAMRTRAAELQQGLEAERATANANFQKAGVAGKVVQDMYGQAKDLASFQQQQTRLDIDQTNAVTARKAAKTQAERLAMELQEKQDFDDSITSAARYDLNLRNIPTTPDNLKAAKFDMIKRYEANDPVVKLYMRGGAVAKNSTGRTAALTASASGLTLGELAQLGTATGDKTLSKLGQDQFYERTNQYLEQIKLTAFNAQPKGKDGQPVQGRQFWEQGLSAADQKAYRAQAEAMARNEVYNQSPMSFLGKKTSNRDVGQNPLNLAAFKTPAMLQQTYKISPEAAKVLSNPQAQLRIHTAGANSSSDRFTSQLVQMMKELDAAKIKNSSGIVAQISGISGKSAIDEDEETKTLGGMGIVSSGSGIITYKGQPYKLDSAEDLLRMRQVHDKKVVPSVPAFLAGKAGDLVGTAWNVGANENPLFAPVHAGGAAAAAIVTGLEFKRDKEYGLASGSNPALPLLIETNERNNYGRGSGGFDTVSPVTPEQAAVAASQFTPVGHAPQVAGGIPATELSEAEKVHLQAEMARQLADQREAARNAASPRRTTPVPEATASYTRVKSDADAAYEKELARQRVLRKAEELKRQAAKAEASIK